MTNREIDRSKLTDFIIKPQTCDKVIPKWTSLTRLPLNFLPAMKGRKKGPNIYTFARYRIWLQFPAIPLFAYRQNLHCKYDPLDFWIPREKRDQRTHTHTHIHICTNSITVFPIRAKLQTQHGVLSPPLYILCYLARRPPRRRANFCPAILCCSLVLP